MSGGGEAGPEAPEGRVAAGFTLIELLAVVALIGLLAAIAVPVFLAVRAKAVDASAQSDLVHAKTALVAFAAAHDGDAPAAVDRSGTARWGSTTLDLGPYGWTSGPATTQLVYSPIDGSSWCLLATSGTGASFRVTPSSSGVVAATSCA